MSGLAFILKEQPTKVLVTVRVGLGFIVTVPDALALEQLVTILVATTE